MHLNSGVEPYAGSVSFDTAQKNIESISPWVNKLSACLMKTSFFLCLLFTFACTQSKSRNADQLKKMGYEALPGFVFETTNTLSGIKDTLSIASDKRSNQFMGVDREDPRIMLDEKYGFIFDGRVELGEIIVKSKDGEQVKFRISKEGFVFYDGDRLMANKVLHAIHELAIGQSIVVLDE